MSDYLGERLNLSLAVARAQQALEDAQRALKAFDSRPKFGELRQHPNMKTLFATWEGGRWHVFTKGGSARSTGRYVAADSSDAWDGLTIEQWDRYTV